jgi:RNA polymerase sigma-70 factor (ECF subfamily)
MTAASGTGTEKAQEAKGGKAVSDDKLYRAYLAGDQSAGDQLMLRYADGLTAYLAAFLHNDEDAEDLMLDCFSVILVSKPRIGEGNFRAYLFKMARNKASRLWRLRLRQREFSPAEELPAPGGSPAEAVLSGERSAILHRCLNRIPPQYREALWLIYDGGLSYAQAANVLGCGVKKIDNLLANGKKRLRQELEKEGITHADV